MIRSLLRGAKTQTRRAVKSDAHRIYWNPVMVRGYAGWVDEHGRPVRCPYGVPGDTLWVKEAHAMRGDGKCAVYQVDCEHAGKPAPCDLYGGAYPSKWRSSRFMFRWASRIDLKVTGVRVERVQDISEDDAKAEGAMFHDGRPIGHHGWRHDFGAVYPTARHSFADLWQTINAKRGYSWESNPYVWVVEFERLTGGPR